MEHICGKCPGPKGLNDYILKHEKSTINICCCCSKQKKTISFDLLANHIIDCFRKFFCPLYDSGASNDYDTGQWNIAGQGPRDILIDNNINESILDELKPYFKDIDIEEWTENDHFIPDPDEELFSNCWSIFCNLVITKKRFFLFHPSVNIFPKEREKLSLDYILNGLKESILRHKLLITAQKGLKIQRVRGLRDGKEKLKAEFENIVPPPPKYASNSRMSPSGIVMFYGAEDEKTCLEEIDIKANSNYIWGEFELIQDITILDLTKEITFISSDIFSDYPDNTWA